MIAETISLDSALGLVLGRDDFVEISCQPVAQGCLHHLDTVLARTPKRLATFLIDHFRYLTKFTASLRTFGIFGTFVYGIFLILALGVAKLMIHYVQITISLQCGIIKPIFNKNRPYWIIKLIQYER